MSTTHLLGWAVAIVILSLPGPARADEVACQYSYGGEEKWLLARPVSSPYEVPVAQVGAVADPSPSIWLASGCQVNVKVSEIECPSVDTVCHTTVYSPG